MTKNPHGLNDQIWDFCRRYVKQGFTNATGAYRDSHPKCKSPKAAESGASRLLANAKVSAYLAEVKAKASEKTQVTADRVLEELGVVAFTEVPENEIRASDKVSALEKIGKHFGMFTEKRADEHGGEPAPEAPMTRKEIADLWEGIKRIKSIERLEKMLVAAAKKQAARSKR